jgi:hypothetical protein
MRTIIKQKIPVNEHFRHLSTLTLPQAVSLPKIKNKISPAAEPGCSSPYSQEPVFVYYLEPVKYTSQLNNILL